MMKRSTSLSLALSQSQKHRRPLFVANASHVDVVNAYNGSPWQSQQWSPWRAVFARPELLRRRRPPLFLGLALGLRARHVTSHSCTESCGEIGIRNSEFEFATALHSPSTSGHLHRPSMQLNSSMFECCDAGWRRVPVSCLRVI